MLYAGCSLLARKVMGFTTAAWMGGENSIGDLIVLIVLVEIQVVLELKKKWKQFVSRLSVLRGYIFLPQGFTDPSIFRIFIKLKLN